MSSGDNPFVSKAMFKAMFIKGECVCIHTYYYVEVHLSCKNIWWVHIRWGDEKNGKRLEGPVCASKCLSSKKICTEH